ncbi:unnamed protein product [Paramecium sonneborni]|uniref:Uncharacterized protein n=1 Tax=Paramecium sonneborni TaxID=65129 RepID=A0A8S1MIV1_9CILI|nr:unnamed protein product [Paramecium sonneborni]
MTNSIQQQKFLNLTVIRIESCCLRNKLRTWNTNNRITVAKQRKSKTIEQVDVQQYKEQIVKRFNSIIINLNKLCLTHIKSSLNFQFKLVQCVKINSIYCDEIYSINTENLVEECQKIF